MQVTVDIPDELAAQVAARGVVLEAYVRSLVVSDASGLHARRVHLEPGPYSPEQAGRNLRELRKNNFLNGIIIKDLIEEGRKI